jgi:hypothetical protein
MNYMVGWIDADGQLRGGRPGPSYMSPRVFGTVGEAADYLCAQLQMGARDAWIHDGDQMVIEFDRIVKHCQARGRG